MCYNINTGKKNCDKRLAFSDDFYLAKKITQRKNRHLQKWRFLRYKNTPGKPTP